MNDLRWILLALVIVVVAGVYFFSRARKNSQPSSLLDAADEVPSFSAKEESVDNAWMDGVGPVRVVAGSEKLPEVKFIDDADIAAPVDVVVQNIKRDESVSEQEETSAVQKSSLDEVKTIDAEIEKTSPPARPEATAKETVVETPAENKPVENKSVEKKQEPEPAIDDVISVYVLAKVEEKINGEKILSASYALHLDYGDMKIFHRHSQTSERKIEFSMANIQQPGYFEIDSMNDMQTTGVSFFMQVNLVDKPSAVLDEMLICAHSLSTMIGAMLCDGQRKILDESGTNTLREKVKYLEEMKSQSV